MIKPTTTTTIYRDARDAATVVSQPSSHVRIITLHARIDRTTTARYRRWPRRRGDGRGWIVVISEPLTTAGIRRAPYPYTSACVCVCLSLRLYIVYYIYCCIHVCVCTIYTPLRRSPSPPERPHAIPRPTEYFLPFWLSFFFFCHFSLFSVRVARTLSRFFQSVRARTVAAISLTRCHELVLRLRRLDLAAFHH